MLFLLQCLLDCGLSLTFLLVLAKTHTGALFLLLFSLTSISFFSTVLLRAIVFSGSFEVCIWNKEHIK